MSMAGMGPALVGISSWDYGPNVVRSLIDDLRAVREPNSEQVLVTAPVEQVRRLVLEPARMAELGEEIESISWLDEADAPALGARFLGRNRKGRRRWETECTVTECTPDRLGYDVHARAGNARVPSPTGATTSNRSMPPPVGSLRPTGSRRRCGSRRSVPSSPVRPGARPPTARTSRPRWSGSVRSSSSPAGTSRHPEAAGFEYGLAILRYGIKK